MPYVDEIKCNKCGFSTGPSSASYLYTLKGEQEIPLYHPCEAQILEEATGLAWYAARQAGLLRTKHRCICGSCAHIADLDIERFPKRCPACNSEALFSLSAAAKQTCPKCKTGTLELIPIGVS